MDFYYQSGDFFTTSSSKAWITILSMIVSTFTALYIVIRKEGKDKEIEVKKENQRIQELMEYFDTTILFLVNSINEQIIIVQDLIYEFDKREYKGLEFKESPSIKTDGIFRTISFPDLMKLVKLKGKTNEDYNRIISSFDYLDKVKFDYNLLKSQYGDIYIKNYNNFTHHSEIVFKSYYTLLRGEKINYPILLSKYKEVMGKWVNTDFEIDENEPYIIFDYVIKPLYEFVEKHIETNDFTLELFGSLTYCKNYIKSFDKVRSFYKNSLSDLKSNLESINTNLLSINNN